MSRPTDRNAQDQPEYKSKTSAMIMNIGMEVLFTYLNSAALN